MARFDAFWEEMCDHRDYLWLGIQVLIFLFVLSIIALAWAPRGSGSFWIAVADFVLIVVLGACIGGMFYVCLKREERFY